MLLVENTVEVLLHVIFDVDDPGLLQRPQSSERTELERRSVKPGIGREPDVLLDEFHVDLVHDLLLDDILKAFFDSRGKVRKQAENVSFVLTFYLQELLFFATKKITFLRKDSCLTNARSCWTFLDFDRIGHLFSPCFLSIQLLAVFVKFLLNDFHHSLADNNASVNDDSGTSKERYFLSY